MQEGLAAHGFEVFRESEFCKACAICEGLRTDIAEALRYIVQPK